VIVEILQQLKVYISEEERPVAETFLRVYEPYGGQGTLEGNLTESKELKKQTEQCRFCKKTRSETTFAQHTHLISRLLGNNRVYSYDECDTCNKLFGTLETELGASLGTHRTFDHLISERKAPGFESGNGKVRIKKLPNGNVILNTKSGSSEDIQVDFLTGKLGINMTTQPYRPESLYRSLLKMALAMLPANDVPGYDLAFKFLLSPEQYPELNKFKKAVVVETAIVLARPFAIIFKKKTGVNSPESSEHVFCLFIGHFMFQVSIPGHILNFDSTHDFTYLPAPYFQLDVSNTHDNVIVHRSTQDLQSTEKIKRDTSMQFQFPTENLVAINLGEDFVKSIEKRMWK